MPYLLTIATGHRIECIIVNLFNMGTLVIAISYIILHTNIKAKYKNLKW